MSKWTSEPAVLAPGAPAQVAAQESRFGSSRLLEHSCLTLCAVALFALGWRNMDLLGDSFWSVATGRWILEHGALPSVDPFSFTAERTWIVHMPLCQILFGAVAEQLGVLGLELFGSLVFFAALLVLWLSQARSFAVRLALWPGLVLLVLAQAQDLCVRGQLFGDLGFALLLVALFRLRDGKRVPPLCAVALGALWINLHASVFLAVLLPPAFGLALRLEPRAGRPALRPWFELSGCAALGMLCNPYGLGLVRDLLSLLLASSTASLDLFGPADFTSPPTLLLFAAVLGIGAALVYWRSPDAGLPEAALLAVLGAAAAVGRRYEPLALGFALAAAGRVLRGRAPSLPAGVKAGLATLVSLCAAGLCAHGLALDKDPWRDVPLDEARLIEEAQLPDRIANLYHWGGYLDYAWAGRRKVFIDGRNQLFDRRVFRDFQRLNRLDRWQEVLDRYAVNTVLWESGSALDQALLASPDWALARRGRIAVVYVRRSALPAQRAAVPRHG
jgi:hypothetical protein